MEDKEKVPSKVGSDSDEDEDFDAASGSDESDEDDSQLIEESNSDKNWW